jgi:MFS family permease
MVPFAFASLVHGPLSDAVGRRPVMIWGMALYTVGSVACTFAPTTSMLIAARVLQGAPPASAWSSAAPSIRDLYRGASAQRLMNLHHDDLQPRAGRRADHRRLGHVAFGWRAVFAVMVSAASSSRRRRGGSCPKRIRPRRAFPFNARNLVLDVVTVLRHRNS